MKSFTTVDADFPAFSNVMQRINLNSLFILIDHSSMFLGLSTLPTRALLRAFVCLMDIIIHPLHEFKFQYIWE